MNSIKELFLSFIESTKDRLKNPMIGAFVIAWIAVNWRFIAILFFSSKKIEDKISFIETNYFNLQHNLWIPLGIAVFYVLVLPYLMALFDLLSQKGISARKLISKNHRIADIQNKQEIAAEEWQLEKIREGSPDIQAMKEKIANLELQLEEKDEVISNLSENVDVPEETVNKSEKTDSEPKKSKTTTRRKTTSKKQKSESIPADNKSTEERRYSSKEYPIMKDIVIRDLAKTEREWILIYALYSSDFGKNTITREDLLNKYSESNRRTSSRLNNLTNNIRNMVKADQLKFINDEEMLLTSQGKEVALEILNR